MKKLVSAGLVVVGMMFGTGSQAATFYTTPASNNVLGVMEGWLDGNLYLSAGAGGANIQVEFLGKEAGNVNTFSFGGNLLYSTNTAPTNVNSVAPLPGLPAVAGTTVIFNNVASGLLDFVFNTVSTAGSVVNGFNRLPGTFPAPNSPNFFVSFGQTGDTNLNGDSPTSGTSVIVALDDDGAPDDNHDDLVVRISISNGDIIGCRGDRCGPPQEIPEPSTYALLLAGLLGLGFIARRRMN